MNEPRGRPFAPGNRLGRGRPKGSRNKARAPGQDLLDDHALLLTRKCIVLAMQGDRSAMGICMDRISTPRRDASIHLRLPSIRTLQDLDKAAEKVTQTVGRGGITPAEGEKLMKMFEIRSALVEKGEFESRVKKLEESMTDPKLLPRAA